MQHADYQSLGRGQGGQIKQGWIDWCVLYMGI
jgi:hypothetical protein